MRCSVVVVIAGGACSSKPAPAPPPEPAPTPTTKPAPTPPTAPAPEATLRGHVTVGASVDAKVARRGTLFATYLTAERAQKLLGGEMTLQDFVDMLTRYVVVGPIDLSAAGAKAPFAIPVEPGGIVVWLTLDSKREMFGGLTGTGGVGNLFGFSKPIAIAAGANDSADAIALDQVQAAHEAPDACTGPRHQRITVEAPEVAGSIGNPTTRRACAILPASYAKRRSCRYPVIFELPGWGSNDSDMVSAFKHLPLIDGAAKETAHEAIVVVIDTSTKVGSSYMVDSPVNGAWDRFVSTKLIPAIARSRRRPRARSPATPPVASARCRTAFATPS
jgi:hypothetical protein